jgi:hypothetical protein
MLPWITISDTTEANVDQANTTTIFIIARTSGTMGLHIWLYERRSLIYSFPMKLSPDNKGTSKPPQGRGRGTDRQTGQPSPADYLEEIVKECLCATFQHLKSTRMAKRNHYQFSIYRAYLQRTCWARPSVFSECHMRRLLIHGVDSSPRIMLSRQTPSSALNYKVGGQ